MAERCAFWGGWVVHDGAVCEEAAHCSANRCLNVFIRDANLERLRGKFGQQGREGQVGRVA